MFEGTSRKESAVSFGVLDCSAPLPSKKNTYERLKLNTYVTGPVMFYSGYGSDPRQLSSKLLRNQYSLIREITALTKLHAAKVKDSDALYRKCLKKGGCGIVLAGGEFDAAALKTLNAASDSAPDLNWVVVDSSKHKLRKPSEKELGAKKYSPNSHRLLMLGHPAEGSTQLPAAPFLGSFEEESVVEFVKEFLAAPSEGTHMVDSEKLKLMKRKPPTPQYRGQ